MPPQGVRPAFVLATSATGVLVVGLVDFVTGYDLRVFPLYFVPVAIASQVSGRRAGMAIALLSSLVWFASNVAAGIATNGMGMVGVNAFVQFVAFGTVAWLAGRQRNHLLREWRMSRADPLTGLANARALRERLADEMVRMTASGKSLAIAYVDLDHFKAVNDTFGHATGDEVLKVAARTLTSSLRSSDLVARIGGDEFVLVMPGAPQEAARAVLERLRAALRREAEARDWPVTASVGCVVFREPPAGVDALLSAADAAMYRVKRAGRDRVDVIDATSGSLAEPAPPTP